MNKGPTYNDETSVDLTNAEIDQIMFKLIEKLLPEKYENLDKIVKQIKRLQELLSKEKSPNEKTSKLFEMIMERFNQYEEMMVECIEKLYIKEPLIIPLSVNNFLNEWHNIKRIYAKYHGLLGTYGDNFRNNLILHGRRSRHVIKMLVNEDESIRNNSLIGAMARDVCSTYFMISNDLMVLKQYDKAILAGEVILDWIKYCEAYPVNVPYIQQVLGYNEPLSLSPESYHQEMRSTAYLSLYLSYKQRGFAKQSLILLKKCIENSIIYNPVLLANVIDALESLKENPLQSFQSFQLANLVSNYLKNFKNHNLDLKTKRELASVVKKMDTYLVRSRCDLESLYDSFIEDLNFSCLSLSQDAKDKQVLKITLNPDVAISKKVMTAMAQLALNYNVVVDFKDNIFTIGNCLNLEMKTLKTVLKEMNSKVEDLSLRTAPSLKLKPEVADIKAKPISSTPSSLKSCSSNDIDPDHNRKEKVKTRILKEDVEQETETLSDREKSHGPFTKRELGFTAALEDTDEVFELHGDTIPSGMFYAYCCLDKEMNKFDIKKHQEILKKGEVVAPKEQGIRKMGKKINGHEAFKSTIPNRDLRIVFKFEQEIMTSTGRKVLYRDGDVMTHDEIKRLKLEK